MERDRDTIFALASGRPPAGLAVVRISGPRTRLVLETTLGAVPPARRAAYRAIRAPGGETIDRGVVLFFEGPASYTGEDSAELHLHGGRAVVAATLAILGDLPGLRPATAGEFTRRAFDNGRLDLTAVEAVADLVAAETDAQRRQALRQLDGGLAEVAGDWRRRLLHARALIEAELDFADEDDVPDSAAAAVWADMAQLSADLGKVLAGGRVGERIRDGFEIAILGPPNAGKSSLLNALAGRDVAIVTDVPGTTRDLLEVHLDLGGFAVTLVDTAGLRETTETVEAEGIRRAKARAADADLVLWLADAGQPPPADLHGSETDAGSGPLWIIGTKRDLDSDSKRDSPAARLDHRISAQTGAGLDSLVAALTAHVAGLVPAEPALVTRARHRLCLQAAKTAIDAAVANGAAPLEVRAEGLRQAGEALGELIGRIDVEDVLGAIFSEFCVGK
ncbi:tRNA uridine-5-carboxymethylaminomethyl(34) synthesis GTPase MnmE [Methylobrevis albus]